MNQPLAEAVFWISAVACAVAEIAILRSTFAMRRARKSDLVPAASRGGELAWAVIPALALSALLVATWQRVEARGSHLEMMDHSTMRHSMTTPSAQPEVSRQ
ncbi:MAG: hypothetical protein ABI469_01450 [Gemmatimonadales bacterium]